MEYRTIVALLLSAVSLGAAVIFLRILKVRLIRAAVLLAAWVVVISVLSLSGFFADFSRMPPRLPLALFLPLPLVLFVAFSRRGKTLLSGVPPHQLIYFQAFRIVVEISLWVAVLGGLLPRQISFEGRNFDVVIGLLALPVGYFCFAKRSWPTAVALAFNIVGLLSLLNAVAVAFLSAPTPLRVFHNAPDSSLVGYFPFIFLPAVLVPLAYAGHVFSMVQLGMARSARTGLGDAEKIISEKIA